MPTPIREGLLLSRHFSRQHEQSVVIYLPGSTSPVLRLKANKTFNPRSALPRFPLVLPALCVFQNPISPARTFFITAPLKSIASVLCMSQFGHGIRGNGYKFRTVG